MPERSGRAQPDDSRLGLLLRPQFSPLGIPLLQLGIVGVVTCGVHHELSVMACRSLVRICASMRRIAAGLQMQALPSWDILGCTQTEKKLPLVKGTHSAG